MESVAERHVRAAVHAPDPTPVLIHGPDAPSFDYGGDSLCGEVSGVIEVVLARLGARDLTVNPNPVAHPDAPEVAGKDLDTPTAQNLPALVPQVIHPEVSHVTPAAGHRRRRHPADYHHLPGSMAARCASGSGAAACTEEIPTPAAAK